MSESVNRGGNCVVRSIAPQPRTLVRWSSRFFWKLQKTSGLKSAAGWVRKINERLSCLRREWLIVADNRHRAGHADEKHRRRIRPLRLPELLERKLAGQFC